MKEKQPIGHRNNRLFLVVLFSGFKISFLLLLLFYSDVLKTISCFNSYLCLFVKTNRGRFYAVLSFIIVFYFCKLYVVYKCLSKPYF